MLKQVNGLPPECVTGGCGELHGRKSVLAGSTNFVHCEACGAMMVIIPEDDDESGCVEGVEVSADLDRCPHCSAVDALSEAEGFEWCGECGLNPNEEDVPSEHIAHMWRKGSQLRGCLEKGNLKPENESGKFVRTRCGPHCIHADKCEQKTSSFTFCFQRYRKGAAPFPRHLINQQKKSTTLSPSKKDTVSSTTQAGGTATACAANGWLAKHVMGITYESSNPERHKATGD